MKKNFVWLFFAVAGIALLSCVHDPQFNPTELASELVYSTDSLAVQVGTSGSSVQPSLSGTAPFTFNISSTPTSFGNITIDASGVIKASSSLAAGKYVISVIVINSSGSVPFPDIYKVRAFVPATAPSLLVYTPSIASVLTGTTYASNTPTIQGTSPFTFSIVNNPDPANISINNQGIVSTKVALASGIYPLEINVKNSVSTLGVTFAAALTVNVSSTPVIASALAYSTNTMTINKGGSGTSVIPSLWGTSPFTFSLTTSPDAGAGITINSSNGIISAASTLASGTYNVSVTIDNAAGSVSFPTIYSVTVTTIQTVSFNNDIKPLISDYCKDCHTTGNQTKYTQYANASSNINKILDRVQRAQGSAGFMPKNPPPPPNVTATPLTAAQIELLKDWLAQGLLP
jgi:hypothetical protein